MATDSRLQIVSGRVERVGSYTTVAAYLLRYRYMEHGILINSSGVFHILEGSPLSGIAYSNPV